MGRDSDFYDKLNDDSPPYTPIDDPAAEHSHAQVTADDSASIEASDASGGDEIEAMADGALTSAEVAGARDAGWSAREYIQRIYGIDAAEYDDEAALIEAMSDADANDDARPENKPTFDVQASASGALESDDANPMQNAAQVEAAADSVLTPQEAADVQDMNISAAQYIKNKYDVNAAWINDEDRLMQEISAARRDS